MNDLIDRLSSILTAEERLRLAPPAALPPPVVTPISSIRKIAPGVRHEYSTMYPGNIDHRAFLFLHPNGYVGLHLPDGSFFKMLPAFVSSGSQPRWSRKKPTVFRYLYLNELREFDVSTDQSKVLKAFPFPNINGMGESDTSEDDDHIVLCSGMHVFVYEISTDRIIQEFTAPSTFDNLYLTSQNEPIVGYFDLPSHPGGHFLHRRDGTTSMLTTKSLPHMDSSSDAHGDPIVVYADGWRDKAHIVKRNLRTMEAVDIFTFDFSLAVHISLPDLASFVIVTTFDPKNIFSAVPYANEILMVSFDGGVTSLGKHRSDVSAGKTRDDQYRLEPHASVSPDGKRVVFDSNGDVYLWS